jgi:hypothetical protein
MAEAKYSKVDPGTVEKGMALATEDVTANEEGSRRPGQAKTSKLEISDGQEPSPPRGVKAGGVWGTSLYCGPATTLSGVLCCCLGGWIPASIFYCHPFDKRRAYKVGRTVVTDSGEYIGTPAEVTTFKEGNWNQTDGIDQNQCFTAFMISGVITFILLSIYVSVRHATSSY